MNNNIYIELKENTWGITLEDYTNLPINSNGVKLADGIPDGSNLEVFNLTNGQIEIYAEAFKGLWCER